MQSIQSFSLGTCTDLVDCLLCRNHHPVVFLGRYVPYLIFVSVEVADLTVYVVVVDLTVRVVAEVFIKAESKVVPGKSMVVEVDTTVVRTFQK